MPETGPFRSLSLSLSLSLFFSITFLYAFSSSCRISFLCLLAQKLFRTPFSFEGKLGVVSSLLDSCWSSRRNVFLFDARVLACYARLVNLSSVLNSSRPPRDLCSSFRYQSPFPRLFCVKDWNSKNVNNWAKKGKKRKKEKRNKSWKMKFRVFFFHERERRERRMKEWMRMERARPNVGGEESLNFSRRNIRR